MDELEKYVRTICVVKKKKKVNPTTDLFTTALPLSHQYFKFLRSLATS